MRVPELRVAIAAAIATLALAAAPAHAADPLIAAAGDIACDHLPTTAKTCQQQATSDLLVGQPLAAVLALGDEQYQVGALAAFQQFYEPTWGRLNSITHPAIGNHEYRTAGGQGYFQYFGAAAGPLGTGYYSFDVGAWHLIALNSNCAKVGGCGAGSPEEQWLKNDLAATSATQCTLAYWHQPHFSSGDAGSDDHGDNPTVAFWNDLYAAGADVVLNGHDHDYERFGLQDPSGRADPFGLREIIAGTGGKSHGSFHTILPNSEVRNGGTYGVLEMTLHPDSYDWRFVPIAGKSFTDSGTDQCHGAPTGVLVKVSRLRARLSKAGSVRFYAECPVACQTRAQLTVLIGHRKIRSLRRTRALSANHASAVRVKFAKRELRAIRAALHRRKRLKAELLASVSAGPRKASVKRKFRLRR